MFIISIVLTPIFYIINFNYVNIRQCLNQQPKLFYFNINEILSNILSKCLLIFHIIEEIILHYFKLSNSYNSNLRYILCSIFLIVNALNYFNFKLSFNYVLIPLYSVDIVNTAVDCISGYYANNMTSYYIVVILLLKCSSYICIISNLYKDIICNYINKLKGTIRSLCKAFKLILPFYISLINKKYIFEVGIATTAIVLGRIANFYTPVYLKRAIDLVELKLSDENAKTTFWNDYLYIFIPYFLFKYADEMNIFYTIQNKYFEKVNREIEISISTMIFDKVICLPYNHRVKNNHSKLLHSIDSIARELKDVFYNTVIICNLDIIDYFISIRVYHDAFGLVSTLIFIFSTIIYMGIDTFYSNNREDTDDFKTEEDNLEDIINDNIRGFDIVKFFVGEKRESKRYQESLRKRCNERSNFYSYSTKELVLDILKNICFAICGSICAFKIYNGNGKPSDFVYFASFFDDVFYRIYNFRHLFSNLSDAISSSKELLDITDLPVTFKLEDDPKYIDVISNHPIEFRNVSFSYEDKPLLIKHISLKVSKGKTLAIVGNSGNGKSTLVKLLSKFYHPTSGDILVNGESIKTLDERVVRSFFSIVPQSLSLFNNSFKYNIKYGNPNASDEEMIEAAKKAQIHEMIINQPDGYDTKVGGSGLTLSGGEMQRIALARVFLKNSSVIILDEATSSLDNITENLLQKALKNLSREKKTMVIIAHRLTTIKHADCIICLKDGKIHERGTHDDLLKLKGEYYKLWNNH